MNILKRKPQEKGYIVINIDPYSIAESKLLSMEVTKVLTERFKMEDIKVQLGQIYNRSRNRYIISFDTKDNAIYASKWIREILNGGKVE